MVEKNIHAFEHLDEAHCTALDKHFHEMEHNCSICDFTITDSNSISDEKYTFIITGVPFLFQNFNESIHTSNDFHHLPSRAPPIV